MSLPATRILVADDDPTACLLVQAALGNQGFSVTTVDNGPAALAAFSSETFAMALLDIEMPGLDGYRVCRELRRLYGNSLPIILITGHDDRQAIAAGFAAGASDLISKPINWSTLAQTLRQRLAREPA